MTQPAENGLPACDCDSMGGRFGAHQPECPWQVAYEAQLAAENDTPNRSCAGCGGRLRLVVGRNFYTCETPACGGNVSRFDSPILPGERP